MRLLKGSAWLLTGGLLLGLVCSSPVKATISNDSGETVFVQLCARPAFEGECDATRMRTRLEPLAEYVVSVPQARLADWWQVLNAPRSRVLGCLRLENDREPGRPTFHVSEVEACPE